VGGRKKVNSRFFLSRLALFFYGFLRSFLLRVRKHESAKKELTLTFAHCQSICKLSQVAALQGMDLTGAHQEDSSEADARRCS
jgi:hypothetical protein